MLIICIDKKRSFTNDVHQFQDKMFIQENFTVAGHIHQMMNDVTCERAPNPQSNNSHHLMKTQIKSILVQTFSIINLIYQLTLFCLSFLCQFEWMYEEIYSDFNKKFFPNNKWHSFSMQFSSQHVIHFPNAKLIYRDLFCHKLLSISL